MTTKKQKVGTKAAPKAKSHKAPKKDPRPASKGFVDPVPHRTMSKQFEREHGSPDMPRMHEPVRVKAQRPTPRVSATEITDTIRKVYDAMAIEQRWIFVKSLLDELQELLEDAPKPAAVTVAELESADDPEDVEAHRYGRSADEDSEDLDGDDS